MSKLSIKKPLVAAALALVLSLQLTSHASAAATNEAILAASQAGMSYLADNQSADGNVGGWTDWAVVAAAASGVDQADFANNGVSAVDYLLANPLAPSAAATDVELRMLAIAAAGQDTADFGGVNYNELLAAYHADDQIGDPTLLNDDIFGILAIAVSDDPSLQAMAQDALDYLIASQSAEGGFSWTTDSCPWCGIDSNDTAAALVAFQAAADMGLANAGLDEAVSDALAYLLSTQQPDGGFSYDTAYAASDGSSTTWGLIGLNSLGDEVESEAAAARDWIIGNQNEDGGFNGYAGSDVYTTAHSVIALLGTTWLLQPEPLQPESAVPTTPAPGSTPAPAPTPVVAAVQNKPVVNERQDDTAEVLSEQVATTQLAQETPQKPEDNKPQAADPASDTKAKSNNTWYILLGLVLVAVVWYVIQSKSKQKKS